MFNVYENGKLAKFPEQKIDPSWDNASFKTLEEAIAYAKHYFHPYPYPQKVEIVNYSGYGDTGEIKECTN